MALEEHSSDGLGFSLALFEADLIARELRAQVYACGYRVSPSICWPRSSRDRAKSFPRRVVQQKLWAPTQRWASTTPRIAVNKLRDALGDSAENPRFIETLAKRGYRFIAPVKVVEAQVTPAASEPVMLH